MSKLVKIEQEKINSIEDIRIELWGFYKNHLVKFNDVDAIIEFHNISDKLWRIANRKYEEV